MTLLPIESNIRKYSHTLTIDSVYSPLGLGASNNKQPIVQGSDGISELEDREAALSRNTEGRLIKRAVETVLEETCAEIGVKPEDLGYDMNTLSGLVARVVVTQTGDPQSKEWRSVLVSFKTTIQKLVGSMNDIRVATCGLLMQANEPENVSGAAEIVINTSPDVDLSVRDSRGLTIEMPTNQRIADAISSIRAELFSLPMGRGELPTLDRPNLREILTRKGLIKTL